MEINTKYFGPVTVNDEDKIRFKHGLPGFKNYKTFVVLPLPEAPLYQILQSTEEQMLAFVIANPYLFFKDYEFDIDEASEQELKLDKPEDVELYTVMTIREPFEGSTMNLQAPVIINKKNKEAKQLILNSKTYHTKHTISNKEAGGQHAHP